MNKELIRGMVIFGGGALLAWLLIPSKAAAKTTENRAEQKKKAMAVLETVRAAINDGISNDDFEDLKDDIQEETGLRVYFNPADNRYYVADATGKDILRS